MLSPDSLPQCPTFASVIHLEERSNRGVGWTSVRGATGPSPPHAPTRRRRGAAAAVGAFFGDSYGGGLFAAGGRAPNEIIQIHWDGWWEGWVQSSGLMLTVPTREKILQAIFARRIHNRKHLLLLSGGLWAQLFG